MSEFPDPERGSGWGGSEWAGTERGRAVSGATVGPDYASDAPGSPVGSDLGGSDLGGSGLGGSDLGGPGSTGSHGSAGPDSSTGSGGAGRGGSGSGSGGSGGSGSGPGRSQRPPSAAGTFFSLVREVVLVLVIALGLSLLIKTFVVQAFYIPSPSMESTLIQGDRVLVAKQDWGPMKLQRGDVVVFEDPNHWLEPAAEAPEGAVRSAIRSGLTAVGLLPADSDEHLIKRVIGMPGDKVVCCDAQDRLTVNGRAIDEPYIYGDDKPSEIKFSVTVPAGRIWVMGDHRSVSQDSRYHQDEAGDGAVPVDKVVGRAFVKVWPIGRIGILHLPHSTFTDLPAPGS